MAEDSTSVRQLWEAADGLSGVAFADALGEVAKALFEADRFDEAVTVFEEAAYVYLDCDQIVEAADMHFAAGASYAHDGDWSDALTAYRTSADEYRSYARETQVANCLMRIAATLVELDERFEAMDCYAQACRIYDGEGCAFGRSDAAHAHGELLISMGRYDEALELLLVARADARGQGSGLRVPCIDDDIASALLGLDDVAGAMARLSACVDYFAGVGDHKHLPFARFRVAVARIAGGDAEAALRTLRSVRKHYLECNETYMIAQCESEIANAKHCLEETGSALGNLRRARAIFDTLGKDELVNECDERTAAWAAVSEAA